MAGIDDIDLGRMSQKIDGLTVQVIALEAKLDSLTVSINDMRMAEAKRQGVESVAKWLIGILGGVAGAVLARLVH